MCLWSKQLARVGQHALMSMLGTLGTWRKTLCTCMPLM